MNEKIFIVYDDNAEDIYIVKAKTENDARNIVYEKCIEPVSLYRRGYISSHKKDLRVDELSELFDTANVICLT